MIAVDHHPGAVGTGQIGQSVQIGQDGAGIEQHLTGEDQVECAGAGGFEQALWRHGFQQDLARLHPAGHLSAKAVKLAIGRQHPQRSGRMRRYKAYQEIMGIGGEAERRGIGQLQFIRDMLLRFGPDRPHDPVPFVVRQRRRVLPGGKMTGMAGIGPEMMAVRGEMQAVGIGRQGSGKQMFPAHSWVRSDHNSGKARLPTVLCR